MSKVRTLSYTLNHAIQENFCPGESKRSAKFQLHGETDNKIYSYAHKDCLHSTAKDFAKFVKENFGTRTVYEIDYKQLAAYLEHKAKTCNEKTLLKTVSHFTKLELCCKCTYASKKINWNTKDLVVPISANKTGITKDKPMDWAQRSYDLYRESHTKSESVRYVNRILGHGEERSLSELSHYVSEVW